MSDPLISIIMVDGSFREQFHALRFFAEQTLPRDRYEIIWVEYYNRLHPDLCAAIDAVDNARAVRLNRTGTYHASPCFNHGITEARGALLIIPDADVVPEPTFLETILHDHEQHDQLAQYIHRFNEPQAEHQQDVELDHLRRVCRLTNPANHGSCLTVRKKWMLNINGYDEHPIFGTGFHANDKDVYTRLVNRGLHVRWSPNLRLYHPWHPMTGMVTPHYQPQLALIHQRGLQQATLPYQGIDSARNTAPPENMPRTLAYLEEQMLPLPQRLIRRMRRSLGLAAPTNRHNDNNNPARAACTTG